MSDPAKIRLLMVEDDPTDVLRMEEYLLDSEVPMELHRVERLDAALESLRAEVWDVVLLDLGLPDSQGIDTFHQLYARTREIPVLVLTGLNDEALGVSTVQQGAQDYLVKNQIQGPLLGKAVRYAIERSRLQHALEEVRQKRELERELTGIDRLSRGPAISVSAQIYSASPLRESAPAEFGQIVERYMKVLEQTLDQKVFRVEECSSEMLHELADTLGRLQASPRDVTEIHTSALRRKVENITTERAQAYVEEGRFAVLELMGNLAGYYRQYSAAPVNRAAEAL